MLPGRVPSSLFFVGGSIAAAAKEARQPEQVAEVIPGSVVVNLIDGQVALEERSHENERCDKAMPDAKPETCDHVVLVGRSLKLIRGGSTPGQEPCQQKETEQADQRGSHGDPSCLEYAER